MSQLSRRHGDHVLHAILGQVDAEAIVARDTTARKVPSPLGDARMMGSLQSEDLRR